MADVHAVNWSVLALHLHLRCQRCLMLLFIIARYQLIRVGGWQCQWRGLTNQATESGRVEDLCWRQKRLASQLLKISVSNGKPSFTLTLRFVPYKAILQLIRNGSLRKKAYSLWFGENSFRVWMMPLTRARKCWLLCLEEWRGTNGSLVRSSWLSSSPSSWSSHTSFLIDILKYSSWLLCI